jgi:hypothetical protein
VAERATKYSTTYYVLQVVPASNRVIAVTETRHFLITATISLVASLLALVIADTKVRVHGLLIVTHPPSPLLAIVEAFISIGLATE